MRITVVHDDGSAVEITEEVRTAFDMLREGTRLHRDWSARDVERLATLAEACRYPHPESIREVAEQVRREEDEERAQRAAWYRQRAESVVAALEECG